VYMDHASGTPTSTSVQAAMMPYLSIDFYNPGGLYTKSVSIKNDIEKARGDCAKILGANTNEIIFVDGATEGNNMAIIGSVKSWQKKNPQKTAHIITSVIEHAAVLETCKYLSETGCKVSYLAVDESGYINPKELRDTIDPNTVCVSIGYVNGEVGTVQDIKALVKSVRHFRKKQGSLYPLMHTDAVQAVNYVDLIDVKKLGIDMMTINASKIYGPKKIGILYLKNGTNIEPIIHGGGQEKGLRSGTENVPAIIAMQSALQETRSMAGTEQDRLEILKNYFQKILEQNFNEIVINNIATNSIPNIINVSFPRISHEEIILRLDAKGIMASVKSACKAGEEGDSHVILALRKNSELPTGSLRFSLGRTSTRNDVDYVVKHLKKIIENMNTTYSQYVDK